MYDPNTEIEKAIGLPEQIDPNHQYVYRSGEHGIYNYWWKDIGGNYWKYTNAPEDSVDYDKFAGNALIDPDQPMPHTTPTFYAEDGTKRNVALPPGSQAMLNESYNPQDPQNVWYEKYDDAMGVTKYTYKDADVRENLDLWVQQQLRIADATLTAYRQYTTRLFVSENSKDKTFAVILMLADQGYFDPYDLIQATVGDLEFTDMTVNLLGRKFLADITLLEYLTTLKQGRDPSSPLFEIDTKSGKNPITERHLYSLFSALKMPPSQLVYLHANQIFSRIVHRMLTESVSVNDIEELAMQELARVFSTTDNVRHLVDYQVKDVLMQSYVEAQQDAETDANLADQADGSEEPDPEDSEGVEQPGMEPVAKSLNTVTGDNFGVSFIYSNLANKREDEEEFSQWIQAQPLHDISPEEEDVLQEQLANSSNDGEVDQENPETAVAGGEDTGNEREEGAVAGNEAGPPAPGEGGI